MRKQIVAANWKMNGSIALNQALIDAFQAAACELTENECVIFPPLVYLESVGATLNRPSMLLGAQNMHCAESGAYTGEVSATMLRELGCDYVLLGHSERRALFLEDNDFIYKKLLQANSHGLKPVLCIGETLAEREQGRTEHSLQLQLAKVLDNVSCLEQAVIAYEPVWAIGTGKTATPDMAQETHAFIRRLIAQRSAEIAEKLPLLYGGSVNAANANELFACMDIDGGLVGGASLKVDEFVEIIKCIK